MFVVIYNVVFFGFFLYLKFVFFFLMKKVEEYIISIVRDINLCCCKYENYYFYVYMKIQFNYFDEKLNFKKIMLKFNYY